MITEATIGLAIYGAALSTYNYFLKWKDDQPNIQVELSPGSGLFGEDIIPLYLMSAKNFGKVSVKLSSIYLPLQNGEKLGYIMPGLSGQLPYVLVSGDKITIDWKISLLNKALEEKKYNLDTFCIYFEDALGRKYYSNKIPIIK